jgi:hypothetical protein
MNTPSTQTASDEWLDIVLQHYKEYVTGVYQGIADYDESVAKHAIHTEIAARETAARVDELEQIGYMINQNLGTKHAYEERLAQLRQAAGEGRHE